MLERRNRAGQFAGLKSSPLPQDYLKLVEDVFSTNFDEGLKQYARHETSPRLEARGEVFADELVLAVSLANPGKLVATTLYASMDFDPKASSPTIQDLLSACVDALGAVWGQLLDPKNPAQIEALADASLSALENAPFEWTQVESGRFRVWLKIDKANPSLDQMADDWLKANDPELEERERREQEETEKLFVTGDKAKRGPGSGSIH
jgi:hypothetical protein